LELVQFAKYAVRDSFPATISLYDRIGPILDPTEFPARFFAHTKGSHSLGNEGKILVHLLVVWAASFGIDERGLPENEELSRPSSASAAEEGPSKLVRPGQQQNSNGALIAERRRAERKNRTEAMVQEVLVLIDSHAIMRRPTWDGIRVLLLILPLMEGKLLLVPFFMLANGLPYLLSCRYFDFVRGPPVYVRSDALAGGRVCFSQFVDAFVPPRVGRYDHSRADTLVRAHA
jgi:hypothetical protein